MQRVLSSDLWTEVRKQARASNTRLGAIAYVTRDLVGFRKGDLLVVDASALAIKNGETDASLLQKLHNKGVRLFDCPDLHAKILLLEDVAIIGSGNMSSSSEKRMVEAALISDNRSVVGGVASLIEQLVKQSAELDKKQLAQLCKIKVIRRGGWNAARPNRRKPPISQLGNKTWIVGVHELKHDPRPEEQTLIDRATQSLKEQLGGAKDDFNWIKWGVRDRFSQEAQTGDWLIQIWRSAGAKRPSAVVKPVPVLRKQPTKQWTRFYFREPLGRAPEMTWGRFQQLLKEIGYPRQVKTGSVQLVESDIADTISRKWNSAARQ